MPTSSHDRRQVGDLSSQLAVESSLRMGRIEHRYFEAHVPENINELYLTSLFPYRTTKHFSRLQFCVFQIVFDDALTTSLNG